MPSSSTATVRVGVGNSSTIPVTRSATTLASATIARAPVNSGVCRSGGLPARTHSLASSPRRIFARISAARRFHGISGISPSSGMISRVAANASTSSRHRSHLLRWRSVLQRAKKPRSPPACNANVAWFGCFIFLPLPSFDIPAELGAPVRDMRPDCRLRAVHLPSDFFRRQTFDVPQHESRPFAGAEEAQTIFQVVPLFGPDENLFGTFVVAFGGLVNLAEGGAPVAPEEIDGRIRGDSGQPVSGLLLVFELVLAPQGLDEGFLREILGVGGVSDDPVDLYEDPP